MTAEIKSIQGFGFEDLHFFDHALVLYTAALFDTTAVDQDSPSMKQHGTCSFIGDSDVDAVQRMFLHFVELNRNSFSSYLEETGNPYHINIEAISESIWHAPFGFEVFFKNVLSKLEDQNDFNEKSAVILDFIANGNCMTEENYTNYKDVWQTIKHASRLLPLTSATFPSLTLNSYLSIQKSKLSLMKRDEQDEYLEKLHQFAASKSQNQRIYSNVTFQNAKQGAMT